MNRTKIAQLYADKETFGGTEVTVAGWVRSIRDMKNFGFVVLNDGSCFKDLQVVMQHGSDETPGLPNYDEIAATGTGAALIVHGTLELTPDRPQPFELQAAEIQVEGPVADDYPLQKQRQPKEFLRTQQHLRSRTNLFRAVFRVRSVAAFAIHSFFQERGFVYINTPIITASDAEGAGEMFRVTTLDLANVPKLPDGSVDWSQDFFGKATNLTVSGQLQAENFALSFGDVYTFGPTFRAENSNTRRHAAEFWMVEPEMAFCDLAQDMDVAEAMLKYVIRYVMEHCPDEIAMFNKFVDKGLKARLEHVAGSDFARVSYTDAVKILEDAQAAGNGAALQEADLRDRLPGRDQGLLHASQRRQQDRGGRGLPRAGHRRDHRRLAARGAPRRARAPYRRARHGCLAVQVLPRPAPLRRLPPRGLWPGLRASCDVPDRRRQHPRRPAAPAHRGQRGLLMHPTDLLRA